MLNMLMILLRSWVQSAEVRTSESRLLCKCYSYNCLYNRNFLGEHTSLTRRLTRLIEIFNLNPLTRSYENRDFL
jgi:hypothetical protein